MKKRSTKTSREPSRASLREIPEVDVATARIIGRGKHVARAQRSFETVAIDKSLLKLFGGPVALITLLETIAKAVRVGRKKRRAA